MAIETLSILFIVRLHRRLKQIVNISPSAPETNICAGLQSDAVASGEIGEISRSGTIGNEVNSEGLSVVLQTRNLEAGVSFLQQSAGSLSEAEGVVNPERPKIHLKRQNQTVSSLTKIFKPSLSFSRENASKTSGVVITFSNSGAPAAVPSRRYRKAAIVFGALVTILNICLLPYVFYSLVVSFLCPQCK